MRMTRRMDEDAVRDGDEDADECRSYWGAKELGKLGDGGVELGLELTDGGGDDEVEGIKETLLEAGQVRGRGARDDEVLGNEKGEDLVRAQGREDSVGGVGGKVGTVEFDVDLIHDWKRRSKEKRERQLGQMKKEKEI